MYFPDIFTRHPVFSSTFHFYLETCSIHVFSPIFALWCNHDVLNIMNFISFPWAFTSKFKLLPVGYWEKVKLKIKWMVIETKTYQCFAIEVDNWPSLSGHRAASQSTGIPSSSLLKKLSFCKWSVQTFSSAVFLWL